MDAAWTILAAKGGQQVFIPASVDADHWLAKLVGLDAARKICDRFSAGGRGDDILIPMATASRKAEAYAKAIEANLSVNQTAAAVGVHRRTVFRHFAKIRDPNQGELF